MKRISLAEVGRMLSCSFMFIICAVHDLLFFYYRYVKPESIDGIIANLMPLNTFYIDLKHLLNIDRLVVLCFTCCMS